MHKQQFKRELQGNPNLEKALALQLIAMGIIIKRGIPLYEQFERIPQHIIGGMIDGTKRTIKGTPKAAVGLVCGAFNLAEDLMFGAINLGSSNHSVPSYRQSMKNAKRKK